MLRSIITGVGSYIPPKEVKNSDFIEHTFYDASKNELQAKNEEIIDKFLAITGIEARRYAADNILTSDMGTIAAQKAIEKAKIDKESLDYIIVAHNFGDVQKGKMQSDILPSLAARIKHSLAIENPNCVAYDILFGCPGWVQGVIQAHAYIQAGMAQRCLVIGTEALSRVVDPYDRDSMIYADGAGACIVEQKEAQATTGILSVGALSHTKEEAYYLHFGESYKPEKEGEENRYIKMHGRKIYEYALTNVPLAMKQCLDKSGVALKDIKKILIHQANEKMDYAIIKRFYRLMGERVIPEGIMPMSIHLLGNSSVATVPTLLDLILEGKLQDHELKAGDTILLASVGAGMNINAIVYRLPVA